MNATDEVFAGHFNAETEVKATPDPAAKKIDLYFVQYYPHDRLVAKKIEWEQSLYNEWTKPILSLTYKNAQQLMNELWTCGIRPTGTTESATQAHLNDMRAIVAEKLKVTL